MRIDEYATSLTFLVGDKYLGAYLDPESQGIMLERVSLLRSYRHRTPSIKWEVYIPRATPLAFKRNDDSLQADVAGIIEGEGDEVKEVRTVLRIWSLDEALCYRAGVDAKQVRSKITKTGKRVMVRFHFDRREKDATRPEPIYHLQVGGIALRNENCWFPNQLDVPRFHFPPMDIVLLCELVLVNLFPESSRNLREKPEWKQLVVKSQNAFQGSYFNRFYSCVSNTTNTILGHLIS